MTTTLHEIGRHIIHHGDCLEVLRQLPADSIHCCVTSPPYFGMRNYSVDSQIGLEEAPWDYVDKLVEVFKEVKRVLRPDSCCWLMIGDTYAGREGYRREGEHIKRRDLIGTPWMLAMALRKDGWWLRSDVIWSKTSCLPENILDRPTRSHEHVFLLTKNEHYFYDCDAIREPVESVTLANRTYGEGGIKGGEEVLGRNKRDVWHLSTARFKGAHFAVFPVPLVTPAILSGTSEKGCCSICGAQWTRNMEYVKNPKGILGHVGHNSDTRNSRTVVKMRIQDGKRMVDGHNPTQVRKGKMLGWKKPCKCGGEVVPSVVLDPFAGSGTVGDVCERTGRRFIGIELNSEYVEICRKRIRDTIENP